MKKLVCLTALCALCASGEVILDRSFNDDKDFKGTYGRLPEYSRIVELPEGGKAAEFTVPDDPAVKPTSTVAFHIPGEKIRGRRVLFTGEVKIVEARETSKWGGGAFTLWFPYEKGRKGSGYDHLPLGVKSEGWKPLRKEIDVPVYASHLLFTVGLTNARGAILFRNLKVEAGEDTLLTFPEAANRGFKDEIAGDGKGGWHDGGSAYDARNFNFRARRFANVPFSTIDPAKNGGNGVIVFTSPRFPEGAKEVTAELDAPGKHLYLLHAAAWTKKDETAGIIEVLDDRGKSFSFEVVVGRDVADWFPLRAAPNTIPGAEFAAGDGTGGVYVSRFALPEGSGRIRKLTLKHPEGAKTMWLVLAATLSPELYTVAKPEKRIIRADEVWKPLPQEVIPAPQAGTALDFDLLFHNRPCGTNGRVILTPGGHFAFEKMPDQPLRFLAVGSGRDFGSYFGVPPECDSKERITRYAEQMRRNGYNLIRWWPHTRTQAQKAFEEDPQRRDLQDWLYHELKRNGIYVILSIDNWTAGYDYCNIWTDPRKAAHSIYLDPVHRESWLKWLTLNLTRVNPYTGTRLLDDPMLIGIDCNNELEFKFMRADDRYAPLWQAFLKKKYGTVEALKQAWGREAGAVTDFADLKTFRAPGNDAPGALRRDRAEFVTAEERGLLEWQVAKIRELGFPGVVTNFCMGRSMRYVGVRRAADFVMQNGYHAHPSGGTVTSGGRTAQNSAIGVEANNLRTFLAARMYGKPYVISEHGHVFWNQYRYEQGLLMGAYAALNNLDALTAFFMQVTTHPNQRLTAFEIRHDPISRASELITALLFRRADARSSTQSIRIKLDPEEAVRSGMANDSVSATQLKLGLILNTSVDPTNQPAKANEVVMNRLGSSETAVRSADTNIVDVPSRGFRLDDLIAKLKEEGAIPAGNRSSEERGVFESATGEIVLEAKRNFLRVNTPRLQGISAEAGTAELLPAFEIRSMNRRACVVLAAVDGEKTIPEAERLLLFVMTNVLNSNMSFADDSLVERLESGTTPLLLETGAFKLAVKTPKAAKLKLYPLRLDGTRMTEVPMAVKDGRAEFTLETANYPTLYFELAGK